MEFEELPRSTDGLGFGIGTSPCSNRGPNTFAVGGGPVTAAVLLNRTRPFSFFSAALDSPFLGLGDPSGEVKPYPSLALELDPGSGSSGEGEEFDEACMGSEGLVNERRNKENGGSNQVESRKCFQWSINVCFC